MPLCLIQVPYMIGDARHGASRGPQHLLEAGFDRPLPPNGVTVRVERIERREPYRDSVTASMAVNRQLAATVRRSIEAGELPLVLAGSCDVCLGILSGFDHTQCGVVWLDAHGDFNTPESTATGFFPGMSLAIITGHCFRKLWTQMGNSTPISEAATLLVGVRDLDAEEHERLGRSAVQVVNWYEGKPKADIPASMDLLAMRVQEIYLHIDLDVLDPAVAPGIVDNPVPGGLSLEEVEQVIHGVTTRFRIRAAALTTYNPDLDVDGRTLDAGLRIIELLAQGAGSGSSKKCRENDRWEERS